MALSAAFQQAVTDSKKLTEKPDNEELLRLYALYKVSHGEDIEKAPVPSFYEFAAKKKREYWQNAIDEGLTAETAQEKYVKLVEELKAKYKFDPNKEPEPVSN